MQKLDDCEVTLREGQEEVRMSKPTFRLVVCIDVDAESLLEAYGKVYEAMGKITGPTSGMDWESSDEAYTPDAEPISEEELSKTRMAYLDKRSQVQFARLLDEIVAALGPHR